VRVHPEILAKEKMPTNLVTKDIWKERFKDIRAFERYLARNGTLILKFFLHVSKEEQKRRFLERIDEPSKNWKFSMGDVAERKLWDQYMAAYEDMIRHTSRPEAPWHVVPADNKWFTRLVVPPRLWRRWTGLGSSIRRCLERRAATWKKPARYCAKSADILASCGIGPWSNSIMACVHV
jgi:polyphosphate kinase 2 (PPK2 family)